MVRKTPTTKVQERSMEMPNNKNMLMKAQVFYNNTMMKLKVANKEFKHFEGKKVREETQIRPGKRSGKMQIETASESECSSAGATDQSGACTDPGSGPYTQT